MNWGKDIENIEFLLIAAFILLYGLYFFRIQLKSKLLKGGVLYTIPKFILRCAYFALLIISLLGPSFGSQERDVKTISKDIFIAVDLSLSMDANDIPPSRLGKLKFELKNLIRKFPGERIGLIIFSSEAFVQCPITYDRTALNMFVETLNTDLVPKTGTDLMAPLEMALDKHSQEEKTTKPTSKIIILISDGEDFSESAEEVAEKIKDAGIRLYTVGIGTARGSKIPVRRGFKKDKNGNEVLTKLNRSGLKKLASLTGGSYYEINKTKNEAEKLINDIAKIKGEVRDKRKMDVKTNKYFYFLLAAMLLIAMDVLITINVLRFD